MKLDRKTIIVLAVLAFLGWWLYVNPWSFGLVIIALLVLGVIYAFANGLIGGLK